MTIKEALGLLLTIISIVVIIAGFSIGGGKVPSDIAPVVAIMGFVVLLIGPWLWLGETPVAIRKFIEARTGRKLEGEKK